MNDEELLRCFQRGLIPGPQESEEAFLVRIARSPSLSHPEWQEASSKTQALWGYCIDWMPIHYSNRQLAWWEGAATWISDRPFIQLRKGFQKGRYLGHDRTEILAHEAVHSARIQFHEPQFEEMLAYSVSTKAWKRFLGPLFSRSWEPLVLVAAIFGGFFWVTIPILVFSFSLAWLGWSHSLFRKRRKILPFSVVLCLTDREIRTGQIELGCETLRMRVIRLLLDQTNKIVVN